MSGPRLDPIAVTREYLQAGLLYATKRRMAKVPLQPTIGAVALLLDALTPQPAPRLPLLLNHDPRHPVGYITVEGVKWRVTFLTPYAVTVNQFFETFGNCGVQILERQVRDGVEYVQEALIMEFSINRAAYRER